MNKYYVYEWFIKDTEEVFYVGKGTKRRAWQLKDNSFFRKMLDTHSCDVRIVADNLEEKEAFSKEISLIKFYREKTNFRLTNVSNGGNQPPLRFGEESCSKRPEVKSKMRESALKRWKDEEYRKKCENSFKQFYQSVSGKEIASKRNSQNMKNPDIRKKISESNIKYFQSEENRKKRSEIMKRCFNNKATIEVHKKKIVQLDLDGNFFRSFNSLVEAANETGIKFKQISKVLRGVNKTSKGCKWMYKEDYEKYIACKIPK